MFRGQAALRAGRARRERVDGERDGGEGRRLEWDGVDVFPFEDGLIARKDVYSSSHRPRVLSDACGRTAAPP